MNIDQKSPEIKETLIKLQDIKLVEIKRIFRKLSEIKKILFKNLEMKKCLENCGKLRKSHKSVIAQRCIYFW